MTEYFLLLESWCLLHGVDSTLVVVLRILGSHQMRGNGGLVSAISTNDKIQ